MVYLYQICFLKIYILNKQIEINRYNLLLLIISSRKNRRVYEVYKDGRLRKWLCYVNGFEEKIDNPNEVAIAVSDRHFGIGSDGLIIINPSEVADFKMCMYNADGSEGKMCGNGIRCVCKICLWF